ncbi:MAG: ribonuclease domain-containing protein [Betaproteobacteria bacterium]
MKSGAYIRNAVAGFALAAAFFWVPAALARATPESIPEIAAADLPKEGREVLMLIHEGGPFRYDRDGVVFGNYEHLLPAERKGYYYEYTVRTPGSKSRGARRIICGGPAKAPVTCFYTSDHYRSFKRIHE